MAGQPWLRWKDNYSNNNTTLQLFLLLRKQFIIRGFPEVIYTFIYTFIQIVVGICAVLMADAVLSGEVN